MSQPEIFSKEVPAKKKFENPCSRDWSLLFIHLTRTAVPEQDSPAHAFASVLQDQQGPAVGLREEFGL